MKKKLDMVWAVILTNTDGAEELISACNTRSEARDEVYWYAQYTRETEHYSSAKFIREQTSKREVVSKRPDAKKVNTIWVVTCQNGLYTDGRECVVDGCASRQVARDLKTNCDFNVEADERFTVAKFIRA